MSSNGQGGGVVSQGYKKITFQANTILPDAPVGEWGASVQRTKTKIKPDKNGAPMVTFQVRLDTAEESENESAQGTVLPLRVFILDDADLSIPAFRKKQTKMLLRELAHHCSFDLDIIPTDFADANGDTTQESVEAALAPFIAAVEGSTLQVWTTHRDDKQDASIKQVDLHLSKPGQAYGAPTVSRSTDDEDEDETPVEAVSAKSKKSGKRR